MYNRCRKVEKYKTLSITTYSDVSKPSFDHITHLQNLKTLTLSMIAYM